MKSVVDLFCGAGGASEGLCQAGYDIKVVVDNWGQALESHEANHPEAEHIEADILGLDFSTLPHHPDMLWGSPPCPEFSVANRNRDPEKGMVFVRRFLEAVDVLQPKRWVMENVRGVAPYLNGTHFNLLLSADYGTPQTRLRLYAGDYPYPRPTHGRAAIMALDGRPIKHWVSAGEALGLNGMVKTGQTGWGGTGERYSRDLDKPSPTFGSQAGGQWKIITDTTEYMGGDVALRRGTRFGRDIDKPSPTYRGSGGWKIGRAHLAGNPNAGNLWRDKGDPAPTITTPTTGQHLKEVLSKPSNTITSDLNLTSGQRGRDERGRSVLISVGERRIRPLTAEECAALMGFPSDYIFLGNKTAKHRQIGNAVCPQVSFAIGEACLEVSP